MKLDKVGSPGGEKYNLKTDNASKPKTNLCGKPDE